jgi:ABC-2 type transport system ATP-binding protein
MPMIEAHNLSKTFGRRLAVDDLSLQVDEGEVLGFLGPNGAGKTTTIRLLSGIIAPTSGSAVVAGIRPDREPERLHETVGLLTESAGFYDRLTATRNLEYFAGFYEGLQVGLQVEKHLKLTGLWERRRDKVGTFSKGMKQRLALARALLHEPKVLFLDEPTAGLDPEAAQDVRHMIKRLSSEGRTVFLSTHNLAEAEYLCHRIAVIRTRLLALETPSDLRQRLYRRRVVVRLESMPAALPEAVRKLSFVKGVSEEGDRLHVDLMDPDRNRPELVQCIVEGGGRVMEVSEEQHSLEDVYLSLMKEER